MMHVAMADAVFSIHPVYKPYAVRLRGHGSADQLAAAAAAAHGVLVRLFPSQQVALDAALANSLSQVPDGRRKEEGIAVGVEVAAAIVALRANDGSNEGLPYTPPIGLGFWQADPRTGVSPFLSWKDVTPWTLDSANQFRAGPPPSIYGDLFASDLAEMKAIGGVTSSIRTTEQTDIAKFVTDNPVAQYNRLARLVAEAVPSDLETNARAFAHVSLRSQMRSFLASKANLPIISGVRGRAIRNAAAIGHTELEDSSWVSLIPNPPHPEYPANHAVQSAAVVTALKYSYGQDIPPVTLTCPAASCTPGFTMTSGHLDDFKRFSVSPGSTVEFTIATPSNNRGGRVMRSEKKSSAPHMRIVRKERSHVYLSPGFMDLKIRARDVRPDAYSRLCGSASSVDLLRGVRKGTGLDH